jgi:7,8-dihydro-6-hydroxymethylpterin dimethyltransferase
VLREDHTLIPVTQFEFTEAKAYPYRESAAEHARNYVRRHWRFRKPVECGTDCEFNSSAGFLDRAQSHFLCISGMAFQDAWNVDLQRLQRCCVHVVSPAGKLVPFCVYYMTNSKGQRLINSAQFGI